MVKDLSDSGNDSYRLAAKDLLCASSIDRKAHTFVNSIVEHWLEREIPQWVHHERLI